MIFHHVRDSVSIAKIPPNFWSFDRGGDRFESLAEQTKNTAAWFRMDERVMGRLSRVGLRGDDRKASPAKETQVISREREAESIASGINLSFVVGKSRGSRKRGRKRRRDVSTPVYRCFIGVFSLLSSPTFSSPVYISLSIVFPWWPVTSHFARTVS